MQANLSSAFTLLASTVREHEPPVVYQQASSSTNDGLPLEQATDVDSLPGSPTIKLHLHDELLLADFEPPTKRRRVNDGASVAPPTVWPPLNFDMPQLVTRDDATVHIHARHQRDLPPVQAWALPAPKLVWEPAWEPGQQSQTADQEAAPATLAVTLEARSERPLSSHIHISRNSVAVRPAIDAKVVPSFTSYHDELSSTGTFNVRELIDSLKNGGRFWNGEGDRIWYAKALMNLLARMSTLQGTPKAQFDPQEYAQLVRESLRWLALAALAITQIEPGVPAVVHLQPPLEGDLHAENVISCHLLRLMRDYGNLRKLALSVSDLLERSEKKTFRWGVKFTLFSQWDSGTIRLKPAELDALCTLKLKKNSSPMRLLGAIRGYAKSLEASTVLADVVENDQKVEHND